MRRPERSEYDDYYSLYIDKVPEGDPLELLQTEMDRTCELLGPLSDEKADYAYADGKWSIKDVVGHLADVERTFGYRAICFARADPAQLPSFDQDPWAVSARAGRRSLADLLVEYRAIRASHVAMFRSFDEECWARTGTASGMQFSTRCLPYIIIGHEVHHRQILEKRYLGNEQSIGG